MSGEEKAGKEGMGEGLYRRSRLESEASPMLATSRGHRWGEVEFLEVESEGDLELYVGARSTNPIRLDSC